MENFSMRKYQKELDFEVVFEKYCDHCFKTVTYRYHGVSLCPEKEKFESIINRLAGRDLRMILDEDGKQLGYCSLGNVYRVGWHREVFLTLWEQQEELTEPVLRRLMEEAFSEPLLKMALCKVTGENVPMVEACRKIGMVEVGCIPEYHCYEGKLYPEYTFMLRKEK